MSYTEICEKLIASLHSDKDAINYFNKNINNIDFFNIFIEVINNNSYIYSDDPKMEAAYYISKFSKEFLSNQEETLLNIFNNIAVCNNDNIMCHIFVALSKIKSAKGIKLLSDTKYTPSRYEEILNNFLYTNKECHEIRASYTSDTISVYQAYNKEIADKFLTIPTQNKLRYENFSEYQILRNSFEKSFNMNRMTWIKPSFLWMMYRSGWGQKENQERILAIDINRKTFDYYVKNSILSTYDEINGISREELKKLVKKSEIRCQWDPERDIYGSPLDYRSLQLGLSGEKLKNFLSQIKNVTDITKYVNDLYNKRNFDIDISNLLPKEKIYNLEVNYD